MRAIFGKRFPGYPCGVRIDASLQLDPTRSPFTASPTKGHHPVQGAPGPLCDVGRHAYVVAI